MFSRKLCETLLSKVSWKHTMGILSIIKRTIYADKTLLYFNWISFRGTAFLLTNSRPIQDKRLVYIGFTNLWLMLHRNHSIYKENQLASFYMIGTLALNILSA